MLMDSADVVLISTSAFVIVLIGSPCDGTGGGGSRRKILLVLFQHHIFSRIQGVFSRIAL